MTENQTPSREPGGTPPATGDPTIDQALARLSELSELPVAQHHDRLAQAHAVLDRALGRSGTDGA